MQRTINAAVLGDAFAERAAAMRTTSVERVKLTANVEQRHFTATHTYTQSAVLRNLIRFSDGNKFAHGHPLNAGRQLTHLCPSHEGSRPADALAKFPSWKGQGWVREFQRHGKV